MKPAKRLGLLLCFLYSLSQGEVWNLVDDWTLGQTACGPWSFVIAANPQDWGSNIDTAVDNFAPAMQLDYNKSANRIMLSEANGNPWSTPAARFFEFNTPSRRLMLQTSVKKDILVKWVSPVDGTVKISGSIQDADSKSGTGKLRLSKYDGRGDDDAKLLTISIVDNATQPDRFECSTAVQNGDVVFVRKTHYKLDDFGCNSSMLTLQITSQTPDASESE
jgi:hypothetical protein